MNESKHRKLLLEQVNEKDIIDEESGNNRYVALTNDSVYFVSLGIQSGHFFGKKIKTFPIDKITSVDIGKKILASYMEITAAGMGGSAYSKARYTEHNENLVFFSNAKLKRFQEIAEKIRSLMNKSKNPVSNSSTADEIEKLHSLMKKGIISQKEFEQKKNKLLNV